MTNDAAGFTAAVDQWLKKAGLQAEEAVRRIALRLWQELVARTPVDTGRARAAWVTSLDEPSDEVPPPGNYGPPSPPDLSRLTLANRVFIVNGVPYAVELEEGSSKQAPAGMVRVSLAQVRSELESLIAESAQAGGSPGR